MARTLPFRTRLIAVMLAIEVVVIAAMTLVALHDIDYALAGGVAQDARHRLILHAGFLSVAVFLASAAVLVPLAVWLTRDLTRLTACARRLAAGDLTVRSLIRRGDEIGELAGAFDETAEALDRRVRELRAQEARLYLVMRATAGGIWDWDLASGEAYFSPRFRELLGYEDEAQFRGRFRLEEDLHPEDRERVVSAQQAHLEHRTPFDEQYRLRCADGNYRWFRGRGQALWDGEGRPLRFAGSLVDITAHKRSEAEISKLNAELEERVRARTAELSAANRELEAFSYSVSHDLTAPLRSIDGFSRILEEDYASGLDEAARGHIARIRSATARMQRLIDDLLALSRITRDEMKREPVDLAGIARNLAVEFAQSAPQRRVDFVIAAHLPACGDPNLLGIALGNLLRNAWKFTAKHESARIEVGCEERGGERVFFVRDDGAGFDMRYASKLFAPFQRMHGVQEFEGTGIGLAIVNRIVQRHGGRIWAEAEPERGATFRFTLG